MQPHLVAQNAEKFDGRIGSKNYGGFERGHWPPRDVYSHKKHCKIIANAKGQTEKQGLESRYGMRISALLDLPYFDPI